MVRQGYKQTDVGTIPEDWELVSINDIGSVSSGGTPSRTNLSYWNGTIPWITTTQIDFNTINDAEQFITKEGLNNSAAKLFPSGTLLIAMYGQGKTRGKVAILGIEASTNQACAAISLSVNVNQNYVFHYLINQYEAIRNLSNTGNQENLNSLIIKSIKVPLPPLPEQRSIAQALSDVDALIAALDKAIAKKRAIKTATMQQLLTGKKRLSGFGEGKGYQKTEVGIIPEDWNVFKFSDITKLITCGIAATPQYVAEGRGYPFLSSSNVKFGKVIWSNFKEISKELHKQLYRNNPPQKGDVLYSRVGTIGEAAVIEVDFEFSIYVSLTLIKPGQNLDSYFLMHLLNSQPYKQRANEQVYLGAGVGNLNVDVVRTYPIILPPEEEQKGIATVLSDMDTEIAALEARLAKTQSIKQGMMQELLTGRTRLI